VSHERVSELSSAPPLPVGFSRLWGNLLFADKNLGRRHMGVAGTPAPVDDTCACALSSEPRTMTGMAPCASAESLAHFDAVPGLRREAW